MAGLDAGQVVIIQELLVGGDRRRQQSLPRAAGAGSQKLPILLPGLIERTGRSAAGQIQPALGNSCATQLSPTR